MLERNRLLTGCSGTVWILAASLFMALSLQASAEDFVYYEPHTGYSELVDSKDPGRFAKSEGPPHAVITGDTKGGTITLNATFADVSAGNGIGFDHSSLGAIRQATATTMLAYIIDVLNETTGASLDIEFRISQTDGAGALASAGTLFAVASQYSNGLASDHIEAGSDPAPEFSDIFVTIDFGYTWNSGTGTPSGSEFDLFTVLLHEVTHGLGFTSLSESDGISGISAGNPGSFSKLDDGLTRITGSLDLWNASFTFVGIASDLISDDVGFSGTNSVAANGSVIPKIYSPSPFDDGSSLSHWDTTTFPNEIMKHSIASGVQQLIYGPLDIAVLKDFGYTSAAAVATLDPLMVYVDFDFTGTEVGTSSFPVNTFAEGLALVATDGTIFLDGSASDRESEWADTISTAMTLDLDPTGSAVRIGVSGAGSKRQGTREANAAGKFSLSESLSAPTSASGGGDADSRGGLSFAEAQLLISGLTLAEFRSLDFDGDNALSEAELVVADAAPSGEGEGEIESKGDTRGGCFSKGNSSKVLRGIKDFFGDLFLLGLLSIILIAWRGYGVRP